MNENENRQVYSLTIEVEKDGDSWCAHFDDFVNLQESECEFGDSPMEAARELMKSMSRLPS